MVIDRHRQLLLGLFLANDVLVEEGLYLLRLGELVRGAGRGGGGAIVFENGIANRDALVADVGPWVVARRRD